MALLSVVLWSGLRIARRRSHDRRAIPRLVQTLQWKTHALHALLSLVPPQGPPALADSALPRNMHTLRLVDRFGFLELLSLVHTEPCLTNLKKEAVK